MLRRQSEPSTKYAAMAGAPTSSITSTGRGKPVLGMVRTDIPLRQCRVLQDARLCIRKDAYKDVYVDLYRDIYRPAS